MVHKISAKRQVFGRNFLIKTENGARMDAVEREIKRAVFTRRPLAP